MGVFPSPLVPCPGPRSGFSGGGEEVRLFLEKEEEEEEEGSKTAVVVVVVGPGIGIEGIWGTRLRLR